MSASEPPAVDGPSSQSHPGRPVLAKKALSDSFSGLRYRDTALTIWQQQQLELCPSTYLSRSQSTWYSSYGNQAVLVRDKRVLEDSEGRSKICSVM